MAKSKKTTDKQSDAINNAAKGSDDENSSPNIEILPPPKAQKAAKAKKRAKSVVEDVSAESEEESPEKPPSKVQKVAKGNPKAKVAINNAAKGSDDENSSPDIEISPPLKAQKAAKALKLSAKSKVVDEEDESDSDDGESDSVEPAKTAKASKQGNLKAKIVKTTKAKKRAKSVDEWDFDDAEEEPEKPSKKPSMRGKKKKDKWIPRKHLEMIVKSFHGNWKRFNVRGKAKTKLLELMCEDLAKKGLIITSHHLLKTWNSLKFAMKISLGSSHTGEHWAFSLLDCRCFFKEESIKVRMRTPLTLKNLGFTPLDEIIAAAEEKYQQEKAAEIIYEFEYEIEEQQQQYEIEEQQEEYEIEEQQEEQEKEIEYDALQDWLDHQLKQLLLHLKPEALAAVQEDIIQTAESYYRTQQEYEMQEQREGEKKISKKSLKMN